MVKRNTLILIACVAIVTILFTVKFLLDANEGNQIIVRRVNAAKALGGKPGIEIEISSKQRPFPNTDATPVLRIGSQIFTLYTHKDGSPNTLIFTLTPEQFAATLDEDAITLQYDPDTQGYWRFGFLEKSWVTNSSQ